MSRKKLRKAYRKKMNRRMRKAQVLLFTLLLAAGFVLSWNFSMRPTESESEKRVLSAFPRFSIRTLINGDFFDGVDLWYSDTFPLREGMVSLNSRIQNLYGFGTRIYGLNDEVSDEIPDQADLTEPGTSDAVDALEYLDEPEELDETLGGTIVDEDAIIEKMGTVVVVNDAGYELYNFNKSVADSYIQTINSTAQQLEGTAQVLDMVVPTSIDIVMPDNAKTGLNISNQADAIRYIYSGFSPLVHPVNVYNTLRSHRTEYIYYRTDHHWSALGAFYAYEQLCRALQTQPYPLSDFTEYTFEGFLGSFYSETGKNTKLANHPDTVYAYAPKADTELTYYNKSGQGTSWFVIGDVTDWVPSSKFSTFIGGDHPYTFIQNNSIDSDKKCLVVKESFGNVLVPFIVANYREVHVIDYRYWSGNVIDFVQSESIDDVVFVNNISATRGAPLMRALKKVCIG